MERKLKNTTKVFLISFALLIFISVLNWGIVSNWGKVKIQRINIVGDNGYKYSALMYVPKDVSNANPAPIHVMFHGAAGNARNHESWSVEWSRRGYICLSVDWNGSGESDSDKSLGKPAYDVAHQFMDYVYSLDIVDKDKIVISGHSMGSQLVATICDDYPVNCVLAMSGASIFGTCNTFNGNVLASVGDSDIDSYEKAYSYFNTNALKYGYIKEGENVEMGKVYGSFEEGNAHVYVMNKDQIHEGVFVKDEVIQLMLDFTSKAIKNPVDIPATDTIWYWKDYVGLFGMLIFAFTLVSLALVMVDQIPFFSVIKQPMPRNIGLRGLGLAISIAAAVLFPLLVIKTGAFGLQTKLGMQNTKLLQMGRANNSTSVVMGTALFGLVMLFVFWFTDAKKANGTLRDLGLTSEGMGNKLNFALIGKALLLAVIVVFIGWDYLSLQTKYLGTDFYCQFFGYKPIAANKCVYYIPYYFIYIICFIVSAVGMNVERRLPSTKNEHLDTAIAIVFNILLANIAVVFVTVLQNHLQLSQGGIAAGGQMMSSWKADITRLWGMPVGMAIGAGGSTYCYRKTGNIWLGAFLMGIICCLGCVLYGQHTIVVA